MIATVSSNSVKIESCHSDKTKRKYSNSKTKESRPTTPQLNLIRDLCETKGYTFLKKKGLTNKRANQIISYLRGTEKHYKFMDEFIKPNN